MAVSAPQNQGGRFSRNFVPRGFRGGYHIDNARANICSTFRGLSWQAVPDIVLYLRGLIQALQDSGFCRFVRCNHWENRNKS